ncbi:ribosome hibernation-promoting factor, HPF/YfiA family [Chloroflexota bacterium]
MEVQITSKNIDISPEVRSRIEHKLGKLNRHLPKITACRVELVGAKTKSPQQRFVAQVTLDANGTLLRGEERGEDLSIVIDKVTDIIDRQIKRYRGKRYRKPRGSSLIRGKSEKLVKGESLRNKVVKVKRFPIKLMPVDEAIEQMELLGHDFFLFHNEENQEFNLLYRREDGNYSIIEPELG